MVCLRCGCCLLFVCLSSASVLLFFVLLCAFCVWRVCFPFVVSCFCFLFFLLIVVILLFSLLLLFSVAVRVLLCVM